MDFFILEEDTLFEFDSFVVSIWLFLIFQLFKLDKYGFPGLPLGWQRRFFNNVTSRKYDEAVSVIVEAFFERARLLHYVRNDDSEVGFHLRPVWPLLFKGKKKAKALRK